METKDIGWEEYAVFSAVLLCSMAIGVFYGCFGSKQKSTKEYLLANRQMPSFPVALSMMCSAVSAITLLSNPVEIYLYGTQYIMVMLSFIPFNLSLAYIYIPVYFNLNVSSAYEFIEMRFDTTVRLFVSILAVLHVVISMAIAIYAPSLAIEQVTGIDTKLSTALIYLVCVFYSALGGLKAVLWTDVLQAAIMLISLAVIAIKGVSDVGGLSIIWERAKDADRIEFFNFDTDPRVRHTIWTSVVAGYFFWLPSYAATQLQVQRFLSMPTLTTARRALAINFVGLVVIVGLCFFTGLVIFAKFHDCDPISAQADENFKSDQLVPYFVESTVDGYPGMLGLFVAGITCASMSSLSSGLSALASITTYDYVKKLFPKLSDVKLSRISKINTLALGLVSYAFVFVIENMGSILPATSSFLGIMLGPTLGIFSLGMLFPWANSKGSLAGMIITFILMITFVIGNNIRSSDLPDQRLPRNISGCPVELNSTTPMSFYHDGVDSNHFTLDLSRAQSDWKHEEDSFLIQLLSISYMWYSGLGCMLCVLFGMVFSVIINLYEGKSVKRKLINPNCISPPILALLRRLAPSHIAMWVAEEGKIFNDDDDEKAHNEDKKYSFQDKLSKSSVHERL